MTITYFALKESELFLHAPQTLQFIADDRKTFKQTAELICRFS